MATGIEIADYPQVLKFIAKFPGEPASGAPVIPQEFAEDWLARMTGRERWPAKWQDKLIADWRVAFRMWGKNKKTGRSQKTRERWQVEKELTAVREAVRLHPKTNWPGNKPLPVAMKLEFEALLERRTTLEAELKGVNE